MTQFFCINWQTKRYDECTIKYSHTAICGVKSSSKPPVCLLESLCKKTFKDENNEDSPGGGGIWSSNDGTGTAGRIGGTSVRIGGVVADHWPVQTDQPTITPNTGWGTQDATTVPTASTWSSAPGINDNARNTLGNPSIANAWGTENGLVSQMPGLTSCFYNHVF